MEIHMEPQNNPADIQKQMRKTGIKIAFCMALLMSFGLSLTGNLLAERPPEMPMTPIIIGFLACFAISFIVASASESLYPFPR